MSYTLGIDLGTTSSAAAINDDGDISILSIGHQAVVMPSVVHMAADGSVLVGAAAERRAKEDPSGIAREFKRRFGDTQPLILNGSPVAANDLMLLLAKRLVASATEQRGEAPSHLVVSHPANWGSYKTSLLSDTLASSSLPEATLLNEPEAAAIHDAGHSNTKVGEVVAVYDLGGGTFDAAIMRKGAQGWELLGQPGGLERLGGIDFDSAILEHVITALELNLEGFDYSDSTARAAMQRLRTECREAKHALSQDTSASVAVLLPGVSETVRITRAEFETLINPALARSLDVFDSTVASAGITMDEISRVLLVGGSSQIPLVMERVQGHTNRPVVRDRHPKHAIALGAAASQPVNPQTNNKKPSAGASSAAGMYQLPHISEGPLPEFMQRRSPASGTALPEDPDATKRLTPTEKPSTPKPPRTAKASQATTSPHVSQPLNSESSGQGETGRPDNSDSPDPARSGAWFWMAILAIAGLAGGASYFALRDRGNEGDQTTSSTASTSDGDQPSDTTAGAATTSVGVVGEGTTPLLVSPFGEACDPGQSPIPGTSYRVAAIPDRFPEKTLNGRNIPGLGTINGVVSSPVTEFPEFSVLDLTYLDCAVDERGRPWWGVKFGDQVVWSSTLFIEVNP